MKTLSLKRLGQLGGWAILLLFVSFCIGPIKADAATCTLYRDLMVGSVGEDVRCLQQYLNDEYLVRLGYTLGHPTGVYTGQTQSAVIWWQQAHGVVPATGYFGPLSRAKFQAVGFTSGTGGGSVVGGVTGNNQEITVRTRILEALDAIEDAEDEINEQVSGYDDGPDYDY